MLLNRDVLDYAIVNKVDHPYVNYNSCYRSLSWFGSVREIQGETVGYTKLQNTKRLRKNSKYEISKKS